jgi:hypothetical protein
LEVITAEETEPSERKGDNVRLFGTNNLKEGAVWRIYATIPITPR